MPQMSPATQKKLENLHDSYKLIFIIIMSVSLIIAADNLLLKEAQTGIGHFKGFRQIAFSEVLLFIVFLLLFARFLLGDLRYINAKYIESQFVEFSPEQYRHLSRFLEFKFLIVQALLFYMLGASLLDFPTFYLLFTVILIYNAVWLVWTFTSTPHRNRQKPEIRNSFTWMVINFSFGVVLIATYMFSNRLEWEYSLYAFVVIAIGNTVLDYWLTWETYFPNLE